MDQRWNAVLVTVGAMVFLVGLASGAGLALICGGTLALSGVWGLTRQRR